MAQPKPKAGEESPPTSLIVPMWDAIFRTLSVISLFWLFRRIYPWFRGEGRSYAIVESWVVAHGILALSAALLAWSGVASGLLTVLLLYGAFHIF